METEFKHQSLLRPRHGNPDSVEISESARKWSGRHANVSYGTVENGCCRELDTAPAPLAGPISRPVQ
jgi:hypothetical protein